MADSSALYMAEKAWLPLLSVTQLGLKLMGPPRECFKTVLFERLHIPALLHELCDYRAAATSSHRLSKAPGSCC